MCLDITVQIEDNDIRLSKGTPDQFGFPDVSSHMVLTGSFIDIRLWIIGTLSTIEKQNVIHGMFKYLDSAVLN
jgi:hypothetical protein